jgi:multiple sugar transport system permease protein
MAVGVLPATEVPFEASARSRSRRRAIRQFKLSLLLPLIALFLFLLTPVLLLQLYFSVHQWTVYLSSWWDADFVGLDLFREVLTDPRFGWAVVRSLLFSTSSTLGCFVFGFLRLPHVRRSAVARSITSYSYCGCSPSRSSSPTRPR